MDDNIKKAMVAMNASTKKAMEAINTPAMKRIAETLASIKPTETPELNISHYMIKGAVIKGAGGIIF